MAAAGDSGRHTSPAGRPGRADSPTRDGFALGDGHMGGVEGQVPVTQAGGDPGAVELGVNHIDTSNYYARDGVAANELITLMGTQNPL